MTAVAEPVETRPSPLPQVVTSSLPGLQGVLSQLIRYCERNQWQGHDPYDALNSRWFEAMPFLDGKWTRLATTQLLKRSPVNLRPVHG